MEEGGQKVAFSEEGKKMLNSVVTTGLLLQPVSAHSHANVCDSRGNEGLEKREGELDDFCGSAPSECL